MAKATYIKSYAHAERLGIKPFDTLISKVAIPARKPKLVAWVGNSGFSARDKGKYTIGRVQEWRDTQGYRYYATTKPMLDILLRALFTRKPRMTKVVYRR